MKKKKKKKDPKHSGLKNGDVSFLCISPGFCGTNSRASHLGKHVPFILLLHSRSWRRHEGNVFVYMVKAESAISRFQPVGRGKERGGAFAHFLRPSQPQK